MNWLITNRWGLALGVAAGLGVWLGWMLNGWRTEGELADFKAAQAIALAAQTENARATEQTWTAAYLAAGENYDQAITGLAADLDAARRAHDGLRQQLAAARRALSENHAAACRPLADAALGISEACAERYIDLAADAGRCAAEQQRLHDAWPGGEAK